MRYPARLLHELALTSAEQEPSSIALRDAAGAMDYATLATQVRSFAAFLGAVRTGRGDRVAVWLDKCREAVIACFGATAHGAVFVPINPLLKPEQVAYILRDCGVRVLVTSYERLRTLEPELSRCPELAHAITTDPKDEAVLAATVSRHAWEHAMNAPPAPHHPVIDADIAAIIYTSGSTGQPKGVVLSHRNLVAGARSVTEYLSNERNDVLLAVLPLSFDAGFSQLTTAFSVGAGVVLLNYLLPPDVVRAVVANRVTGVTAVPALWIQLTQVNWPRSIDEHLRYFASTGGRMPAATLSRLREAMPRAKPFLMYGLTEAFRATYLPPDQVDRRPGSIGKAIPNAEVLVLRADGTPCAPGEPGELVQRGALVALGYWNDLERTAQRFRPLPIASGALLPEMAVFSGDTVRTDEDGFLYFIGRDDEMIKSSGYRISPTEVEEVIYATQLVAECAAFGAPHVALGEVVMVVASVPEGSTLDLKLLQACCRDRLPAYMVPREIAACDTPLPRNANGKIDRKAIAKEYLGRAKRHGTIGPLSDPL